LNVSAPWGGYAPGLSDDVVNYSVAQNCLNVIDRESTLSADTGYALLVPSGGGGLTFPLGDDGAGAIEGPATTPEAIMIVGQLPIQDPTLVSDGFISAFFVTADGGGSTRGHAACINGSANLVEIPFDADAGTPDITTLRAVIMDSCVVPFGGTAQASQNKPGAVVITNNTDNVIVWDPNSDSVGFPGELTALDSGAITNFKGRACAVVAERILFFNTEESGTRNPTRVTWGEIGSLSVDPSPTGAGSIDLIEMKEPGMRIMPLGNLVACYSGDGVVLLRRTGIPLAPFAKDYRTNDRGLIGPRAITPLGRDAHFGIFTDGWFIFSSQGVWREVGLANLGGTTYHKWKDDFYSRLSRDSLDLVVIHYDHIRNQVRISWPETPATENTVTWVYDVRRDTVWPQDYIVSSFGEINSAAAGQTWTATVGTWAAQGVRWRDLGPESGFRELIHGDASGNVMLYNSNLTGRAGVEQNYQYLTYRVANPQPLLERLMSRVTVTRGKTVSAKVISVEVIAADGTANAVSIAGESGTGPFVSYEDYRVLSTHHAINLTGEHPQIVHKLGLSFLEGIKPVTRADGEGV